MELPDYANPHLKKLFNQSTFPFLSVHSGTQVGFLQASTTPPPGHVPCDNMATAGNHNMAIGGNEIYPKKM